MIKYVTGNLVTMAKNGEFDIIGHGCNCFCAMGSGIARSIKEAFPLAWEADCNTIKGHPGKLGTWTSCGYTVDMVSVIVLNMYTQYRYGYAGTQYADYKSIRNVMKKLKNHYSSHPFKIGLPKIGAGLAGGDWAIIEKIINEECGDMDITIVEWDGT